MRLDVEYKGQLTSAVVKVRAILALAPDSSAERDDSGNEILDDTDEDVSTLPREQGESEELVYPRSQLTRAARVAIVAARIARVRAELTEELVAEDEGEAKTGNGDGDAAASEHGVAAQANAAATAAEAAAVDAVVNSMVADPSAGVGATELETLAMYGPNPNSIGHHRLHCSLSKPSVILDPIPPEVPRPLRVGSRTFRPSTPLLTTHQGSQASISDQYQTQTSRPSRARDPRSGQLPGWQQTKDSMQRVAGQTKVTEYAYVVDTGALAVAGISRTKPPAAMQKQNRGVDPRPCARRSEWTNPSSTKKNGAANPNCYTRRSHKDQDKTTEQCQQVQKQPEAGLDEGQQQALEQSRQVQKQPEAGPAEGQEKAKEQSLQMQQQAEEQSAAGVSERADKACEKVGPDEGQQQALEQVQKQPQAGPAEGQEEAKEPSRQVQQRQVPVEEDRAAGVSERADKAWEMVGPDEGQQQALEQVQKQPEAGPDEGGEEALEPSRQVQQQADAGPVEGQEEAKEKSRQVQQQPQPAEKQSAADVSERADKAWKKMKFSQKMSSFTPKELNKKNRKLRQIVQHWYMQDVRYGLSELRDVLASDPFSKKINSGAVHVHEGGALHRFQHDLSRLHDRALSGHGCSKTLNLLRVPREHELLGRRRSLAPGVDVMMGASNCQESELIQELRKQYGVSDDIEASEMHSDTSLLERESIRFHPKIVQLMHDLWKLYDYDNSGFIDEEEYVVINKLVQQVLMAKFEPSESERVAREDWIEDSKGFFELNYERFAASWFQLADLWTHDISVDSYCRFISDMIHCLSYVEEGQGGAAGRRRLHPPHLIVNLQAYRKQKRKGLVTKARMNNKGVWALSLTSATHKESRRKARSEAGLMPVNVEPPPVASDDPAGAASLEQWMNRQLAAGVTKNAVTKALAQYGADAPADSGLAKAAAAVASAQTDGPYQKLVKQVSKVNPVTGWRTTTPDPAPGLHRLTPQPPGPRVIPKSRPASASGQYRLAPTTSITTEKLSILASPKLPVHRTKESVMLEQKMAQLIHDHMQAATQKENHEQQAELAAQQTKDFPEDDSVATATARSIVPVDILDADLPFVHGQHAVCHRPYPQSERRSLISRAVSSTPRASSARSTSRNARSQNDGRWATEWVAAQREEAARVTAARQAAQAARFVSMADIEKGLQHIARKPFRPDPFPSAAATPNATTTDAQKKQLQPRSSHTDNPLTQPQQGCRIDTASSSKLRTGRVRPLTSGGGWRDHTTTKMQPNTVPQALEGAALMSTSWTSERVISDGGYAESVERRGTGVPPPPTAAVLTQGGHVPGWLRYTTMMMRTMPLDQVLDSLYEMGPEAAAQLLPLIAAECDLANPRSTTPNYPEPMPISMQDQPQWQNPSENHPASNGNMPVRSRVAAVTTSVPSLVQPMKWNARVRSYGHAARGGRNDPSMPLARQVYGGGFGKNHTARSKQQVLQH